MMCLRHANVSAAENEEKRRKSWSGIRCMAPRCWLRPMMLDRIQDSPHAASFLMLAESRGLLSRLSSGIS